MSVKIFYFYNVVTDGVHYGLTTSVVVGSAPPSGFMTEFTLTKEFVTTYTDHSGTPRRRREDWNWDEFGILKFVHLLELLKFLQSLQCKDRNNDSIVIYVRYFIFEYIFLYISRDGGGWLCSFLMRTTTSPWVVTVDRHFIVLYLEHLQIFFSSRCTFIW